MQIQCLHSITCSTSSYFLCILLSCILYFLLLVTNLLYISIRLQITASKDSSPKWSVLRYSLNIVWISLLWVLHFMANKVLCAYLGVSQSTHCIVHLYCPFLWFEFDYLLKFLIIIMISRTHLNCDWDVDRRCWAEVTPLTPWRSGSRYHSQPASAECGVFPSLSTALTSALSSCT